MSNNIQLYMQQPAQMQRFAEILGEGPARAYVQSVIIAAQDEKLQGCSEESVFKSALRAATLGLSCDPMQKEAQLIPRNRKGVKEASFEPHYLGLYKLAMRTEKYRSINVVPITKGQEVHMTIEGLHQVYENGKPVVFFPMFKPTKEAMEGVIGFLGHMATYKGAVKTVYRTLEEIEEHAKKYSQAYQTDLKNNTKYSTWSNPDVRPVMQMKTVLRELLNWADLSGTSQAEAVLREAIHADESDVVNVEAEDIDEVDRAFPPDEPGASKAKGRLKKTDATVLKALVEHEIAQDEHEARNIMEKCSYDMQPQEKFVTWATVYRGWLDAGLEVDEAAVKTNAGERP